MIPTVRVFQNPDGSVRVMYLNDRHRRKGETIAQFFARETAKQPELAGLSFVDVDKDGLPATRALRHKWRVRDGRVIEDSTVPDRPHPKQPLLDAIGAAKDLDTLKAELLDGIRRGKL